jgi:hypothetical protein
MTDDKFVCRSLGNLSRELAALGHRACPTTVAGLLRELGYNLRVNFKRLTGPYHPDRDRQFRYLEGLVEEFRAEGLPVLSVDTKKKELVGSLPPSSVRKAPAAEMAMYRRWGLAGSRRIVCRPMPPAPGDHFDPWASRRPARALCGMM